MSFTSLTAQTRTYEPTAAGIYVLSTLSFGDPDDSIVVRAASQSGEPRRFSVSRVLQKDVTVAGDTLRKTATVTNSVVVPSLGFTATDLRGMVLDLADVLSTSNITDILFGRS